MNVRKTSAGCFGAGLAALACANEPPTGSTDVDHPKTHAVVTVDRNDPAADAPGSASAIARFVSVPAFSDPNRVLLAAGATIELPVPDTCQASDAQEDLEPPLPSQGPVEFVEAGDVAISAAGSQTPLVPHVFPTVGAFASGVLYTTRDRASSALPSAVPYVVSVTGSPSVGSLHLATDAPHAPSGILVADAPLRELSEVHTGHAIELAWNPGEASDLVYVELLAYDGSPSVLCTFHDEAGAGTIAGDAFAGGGAGRIAVHRLRARHFDAAGAPPSEIRFDFQVGAAIEFLK
jgi:hypothetical protein